MKLKMTLLVFLEGELQGELDVLARFPDVACALNAIAQLGAANSLLFSHPDVKAILNGLDTKSIARIHEIMPTGTVVQIKSVAEQRNLMPEKPRNSQSAFHIIDWRPHRQILTDRIITVTNDSTIH